MSGTEIGYGVLVSGLRKEFDRFVAVDHLDLKIGAGEIFGFLGPNGSGKSTTIRMLCGILKPTSGDATVAGMDLIHETEKIKSRIGYMSQKFSLYEDLTAEENLEFYGGIYKLSSAKMRERKEWVIEMAGLKDQRGRITGTLPVGWKQRLSLGCAILHEPPVVFLDEPTSGVDPLSRRNFWNLIQDLAGKGMTVFVTTHYVEEAEFCDQIGLIYNGKLIAEGTPLQLKTTAMKHKVIELICDKPVEAAQLLRPLNGVLDAAPFVNAVHVIYEEAENAEEVIRSVLGAAGVGIEQMSFTLPSLEDVFVALIEQSGDVS